MRQGDPEATNELIVVEIRRQRFAIDIMAVREIRGWTASTRLPHAPSHVLGMVNLRGSVLPVIDLGSSLGLGATEPHTASVVIVAEVGDQMAGLMVDAVCDILTLQPGQLQPAPKVGECRVGEFVRGVITAEDGIITLLALEAVVPHVDAMGGMLDQVAA